MGSCLSDKHKGFDSSQVDQSFSAASDRYFHSAPQGINPVQKADSRTASSYVHSSRFRTPTKIPSYNARPPQKNTSFDTPNTADMSWGSSSESEQADQAPSNVVAAPTPEKMSKMDRIRAKAIRSANKELGIDQGKLADALGFQAPNPKVTTPNKGTSTQNGDGTPQGSGNLQGEVEAAQMRYLADSLGLPASFFGVKPVPPSPSKSLDGESAASGHSRNLFQTAMQSVPVSDEMSESGEDDEDDEDDADDSPVMVSPQPHSLASALGMSIDPSSRAPAVRKNDFKPQPKTAEEKRADKEKAMSRLNRIKAKAIKSANKSLGIDTSNLSQAVGMTIEEYEESANTTTTRKEKKNKVPTTQDPEQLQYIADAIGLPVEMFGVKKTSAKEPTAAQPGSLAQALGMSVDTSYDAPPVREFGSPNSRTDPGSSQPQAGSLAAALGMSVDPEFGAPAVRSAAENQSVAESTPSKARAGSLAAALGMAVEEEPAAPSAKSMTPQRPQAGSLAAALGMQVTDEVEPSAPEVGSTPQRGSLADALGMSVSRSPAPVRQAPPIPGTAQPGSLAAALGMGVADSSMGVATVDAAAPSTPNPGSLAAALGMTVDPTNQASPIRQLLEKDMKKTQDRSPQQHAQPGSLAAALGMPVQESRAEPASLQQRTMAQPGSLAAALGAPVEESTLSSAPQPGSLAAALGMQVGNVPESSEVSAPVAARGRAVSYGSVEKPRAGSLAEALGMSVDTNGHASPVRQAEPTSPPKTAAAPQAGSLAAALGMAVDSSYSAPAVRYLGDDNSSNESDDDESRSEGSYSSDEESDVEDAFRRHGASQPKAGSLAAALGMAVDSSVETVVVRETLSNEEAIPPSVRETPSNEEAIPRSTSKKSLFGAVFNNVVALQAPKASKPNAGSLADALGMAVGGSDEVPETPSRAVTISEPVPSTTRGDRSAPRTYPESPGFTVETENIHLRSELAAVQAEIAGAHAYGKALEAQMLEMSKTYAEKVAAFQLQISSYELQLTEKTKEIARLNSDLEDQQKGQEILFDKLCQTGERLGRGRALMDEADAIFQQEFTELMDLKQSIEAQGYATSEDGSVIQEEDNFNQGSMMSSATRDIQHTLQREDSRKEALKARLQAIRDNRKKNGEN